MQQLASEEIHVDSCTHCGGQYFGEPFFCCEKMKLELLDDPLYGYKNSENKQLFDLNFLENVVNEGDGNPFKYNNNLIYFDPINSTKEYIILVHNKTKYVITPGFTKTIKYLNSKNEWRNFIDKKGEFRDMLLKVASQNFLQMQLESSIKKNISEDDVVEIGEIMEMVKYISERSIERAKNRPIDNHNVEPITNVPVDIQTDFSKYGKNIKYNTNKQEDRLTSIEFTYDKRRYKISFYYTTNSIKRDEDIKYSKKSISSLHLGKFFEKATVAFKGARSPYYHGTEKIPHLEKFVYREVNKYINKPDT